MENSVISFKKEVTFSKTITKWLETDITDISDIFDLSVRAHNLLRPLGIQNLKDLLLYSKEELLRGKFLNPENFSDRNEKWLSEEINKRRLQREIKVGKKSMEEINFILNSLNLKLRS